MGLISPHGAPCNPLSSRCMVITFVRFSSTFFLYIYSSSLIQHQGPLSLSAFLRTNSSNGLTGVDPDPVCLSLSASGVHTLAGVASVSLYRTTTILSSLLLCFSSLFLYSVAGDFTSTQQLLHAVTSTACVKILFTWVSFIILASPRSSASTRPPLIQ